MATTINLVSDDEDDSSADLSSLLGSSSERPITLNDVIEALHFDNVQDPTAPDSGTARTSSASGASSTSAPARDDAKKEADDDDSSRPRTKWRTSVATRTSSGIRQSIARTLFMLSSLQRIFRRGTSDATTGHGSISSGGMTPTCCSWRTSSLDCSGAKNLTAPRVASFFPSISRHSYRAWTGSFRAASSEHTTLPGAGSCLHLLGASSCL